VTKWWRRFAVGRDARVIAGLLHRMQKALILIRARVERHTIFDALTGLDIALWDSPRSGREKPLVELLGGRTRMRSTPYDQPLPADTTRGRCHADARGVDEGYRCIQAARDAEPEVKGCARGRWFRRAIMVDTKLSLDAGEARGERARLKPYDLHGSRSRSFRRENVPRTGGAGRGDRDSTRGGSEKPAPSKSSRRCYRAAPSL